MVSGKVGPFQIWGNETKGVGVDKNIETFDTIYNMNIFKRIFILAVFLFTPSVSFAGTHSLDSYAGAVSILMFYSLASAVALGVVTSIIVIVNGRRMKGGIFGGALKYLGVGMLIVLAGTVVSFFPTLVAEPLRNIIPSVLSTIGYVVMAIAASKILKVTKA